MHSSSGPLIRALLPLRSYLSNLKVQGTLPKALRLLNRLVELKMDGNK